MNDIARDMPDTDNSHKDSHELNKLPRIFIKGIIVLLIAFIPAFLLNFAMQSFLDDELAVVQAAAEKAAAAQKALQSANEAEKARLEAELNVLKAKQYEEFYQQYKNRESYHYYGQFYEMFENMYSADVLFIGTSHAAHGVNPLYIEEENPDYSFYNFSLNGSNPKYYLDWYEVFKESGYPTPEVIVFCVDWFMCDDGWLWRRISFDDSPNMPIDIMRKINASEKSSSASLSGGASEQKTAETEPVNSQIQETSPFSDTDTNTQDAKKTNFWDLDALLESLFSKIPVIYSRDRIPEMIRHYLKIGVSSNDTVADDTDILDDRSTEEKLPEVPVYEHSFLMDGSGNITSDFYKGFIPWESGYGGGYTSVGSNDNEDQWKALDELLTKFTNDGIKLIFVQVPEHSDRKATNIKFNNNRLSKLAEKYGAAFLNYNDELISDINEDYTNYSDWGHLNKKGSTAFSKVLAKDLKDQLELIK